MKTTTEILQEQIAGVKAKNLKPEHEAKMIAMFEKKFKKSSKNWKRIDAQKEALESPSIYGDMTMEEINRMNAKNNLPSSMR